MEILQNHILIVLALLSGIIALFVNKREQKTFFFLIKTLLLSLSVITVNIGLFEIIVTVLLFVFFVMSLFVRYKTCAKQITTTMDLVIKLSVFAAAAGVLYPVIRLIKKQIITETFIVDDNVKVSILMIGITVLMWSLICLHNRCRDE